MIYYLSQRETGKTGFADSAAAGGRGICMKRQLALCLCLLLLLCGCSAGAGTGAAVEELLRAPQLSGRYSQVQKALNAYLGESAQLKYPVSGEEPSPFLFGDWDGDGREDAAVLYACSKGQNAHLAILEQDDNGWAVTQEVEGLAPEVESAAAATLEDNQGSQLVVGYGSAQGDRYLAVYSYAAETLETVLQESYAEYMLEDITGTGVQSLVLITPETPTLKLLLWQDGSYRPVQELALGAGHFTSCAGLYSGRGAGAGRCIVVDGWTGSALASDLLYFDRGAGQLRRWQTAQELYNSTLRTYTSLYSDDLLQDDRIEIPVQLSTEEGGMISGGLERRLAFIEWRDFSYGSARGRSFGVLDGEYGFYLALPAQWKGQVNLTEGDTEEMWEVRSLDGAEVYLTLRLTDLGQAPEGFVRAATIGSQQISIRAGENVPPEYAANLAARVTVL